MKTYILTLFTVLFLLSHASFAVVHTVSVGGFSFTPSTISDVALGDTVRWVWVSGSHTTTSTTIPGGAIAWDHPMNATSTSFDYIPAVEGVYNYKCSIHVLMGMIGNFTVTPAVTPLSVLTSADPSSLCRGQSSTLHAMASGGTGSYTYNWVSNPPGFTSTLQNVIVSPLVNTSYTVTVISGTQTASAQETVSVSQPPLSSAGNDTTYCSNLAQFTVQGTASNYSSLLWNTSGDGTFTTPAGLTSSYMPGPTDVTSASFNLTLTAFANAPCSVSHTDTVHIILDPCTGIHESGKNTLNISVYPNPSTGTFMISGINDAQPATIQIFDMSGRLIRKEQVQTNANNINSFNLSAEKNGLYEIIVISGDNKGSTRILLQ